MTPRLAGRSVTGTMRVPIRSESDAFRFALGAAAAIGAAVIVGWLTEPMIGLAVLVIASLIAAIAYLYVGGHDRRAVLRVAASEPHPHGAAAGQRHVLVIANERLAGNKLERLILGDGEKEEVEIDILAPVLTSHVHFGVSDIDRELAEARGRLEGSLAWARDHGIAAHGEVGDPSPTTAIEDELRDFGAEQVIVVTRAPEHESWQERHEVERLRRELDVPVTQLAITPPSG